ncbi:hypothetical protein [uncultured Shewanella sp.]|uniref:hypothetical protein n=1 Tax=uncultured Shewanella sp. TaxID=173975 RepID=UPI00261BBE1F|nr:hypothetical protein [uncultured Shewanella sp.]
MPIITNQQLNTLKGGGRELFPALSVDLKQSRYAIVNLSITIMFTGLCYDFKRRPSKEHSEMEQIIRKGHFTPHNIKQSALNCATYDNQTIKNTARTPTGSLHKNKHQLMQLNLTSNQPNIDCHTNLHTFRCPAINNEFKIFHSHVQFLKQQKSVSIVPILNTSHSTIEGMKNACGQFIISFL